MARLTMVLACLIVLGIALSAGGTILILVSSIQGHTDNEIRKGTGIAFGWTPTNQELKRPLLAIYMAPLVNATTTNEMEITIEGVRDDTNTTYTFGLIMPFHIVRGYGYYGGDWTFQNAGTNGSVIRAIFNPKQSGITIYTVAYFVFSNLTYISNHGQYSIFIPIGLGLNYRPIQSALTQLDMTRFEPSQEAQIYIEILTSHSNQIMNSYPSFNIVPPQNLFRSNTPFQQVEYNLTAEHYRPIILTYVNTDESNQYQLYQSFGFLFMGMGIPITIGSVVDLVKERATSSLK